METVTIYWSRDKIYYNFRDKSCSDLKENSSCIVMINVRKKHLTMHNLNDWKIFEIAKSKKFKEISKFNQCKFFVVSESFY